MLAPSALVLLGLVAVADARWAGWFAAGPALVAMAVAGLLTGSWCRPRLAAPACLVGAALLTVANQILDRDSYTPANDLVFFVIVVGAPALVGATWGTGGRQIRQLEHLSEVRSGQRAADVRAARLDERRRIALDVHRDVVQAMSAITVAASGAERGDARQMAGSLRQIELSARASLDELRDHIGILRDEEPQPEPHVPTVAPEPTASRLGAGDLLAAACAVPVAIETVFGNGSNGPVVLNVLLSLMMAAPLAVRRQRPILAIIVFSLLSAVMSSTLTPLPRTVSILLPLLLCAYAAGAHLPTWRRRLLGFVVLAAAVVLIEQVSPPRAQDSDALLATLTLLVVGTLSGVVSARRDERVRRLDALVAEIETGRDAEIRLAAARLRISAARDLHDSVAASMTVVCLHAGAGQRFTTTQTAEMRAALATIIETTRNGITELRAGLDTPGTAPDLESLRLAAVVVAARAAGLDVHLDQVVEQDWPLATEITVARVVREALVNASRHAPGAVIEVSIRRDVSGVSVVVDDAGAPKACPTDTPAGTGHGLHGLRERIVDLGGDLEFGTRDPAGFRVTAHIPVAVGVTR